MLVCLKSAVHSILGIILDGIGLDSTVVMDSIKEDGTSSTSSAREEDLGLPAPTRSGSNDSDDAWMLIEVEKFQEVLDESFMSSSSPSLGLKKPAEDPDKQNFSKQIEEIEQDDVESDGSLSSSNASHSSIDSTNSRAHTPLIEVKTKTDIDVADDTDKTSYSEEVKCCEGSSRNSVGYNVDDQNNNNYCGTIDASEMFRQYYEDHMLPPSSYTSSTTSNSFRTSSVDRLLPDYDSVGGGGEMEMELRKALAAAEEEVAALQLRTELLLDQQEKQERRMAQERLEMLEKQERQERQEREVAAILCTVSQRLQHLERETRQVRHLQEQEGRTLQQQDREEEQEGVREVCVSSLVAQLDDRLSELENELVPLVSRLQASPSTSAATLSHTHDLTDSPLSSGSDNELKISLKSFAINDVALFFPTSKGDYLAFNIGAPHHFLSEESKALIGQDTHFKKLYVLGRIVMKETRRVGAEDEKQEVEHPKGLARQKGIQYHSLSVTSVAQQLL